VSIGQASDKTWNGDNKTDGRNQGKQRSVFIGAYRYVLLPTSPRAVRWHTVRRMIRAELAVSAVAYDLEIPLRRNSVRQLVSLTSSSGWLRKIS
jgi:hypothetical protein